MTRRIRCSTFPPMENKRVDVPNTISASRVPAVLGLDKRCSPLTLFLRLKGVMQEKDISDDEAVREGIFYERATCDICCHKYGMKIVEGFEQKTLVAGPLSGHPDFLVVDEHGKLAIAEVKNPFWSYSGGENDDDWGEPGTDQVPRAYLIQSLVYCHLFREWMEQQKDLVLDLDASGIRAGEVTGDPAGFFAPIDVGDPANPAIARREVADYAYVIARLRGGVERFKVPYDAQIIDAVKREVEMMLTRVQIDDAPDPRDEEDMRNRWLADPEKKAECNVGFVAVLDALRNVKKQIKALTEQESALKMQVLGLARECGVIEFVDHATGERREVATAKPTRSFNAAACFEQHRETLIANDLVTVDTTRLRKEQKALYEAFMEKPDNPTEQKRQIRLKDKAIDAILGMEAQR